MTRWLHLILLLTTTVSALADIRVQDDQGREIRLASPATRIVTLAPHATELILAVGAGKNLVAVAQFHGYPDSLQHLPRLNTLGGLDREYLLETNPDLVIAWGSGNRPADLEWLKQTGIAVFVSEPGSLSDVASSLERLGQLTGNREAGIRAANSFTHDLDTACSNRVSHLPIPTYFEIWPNPPMTIGNRHWLNEILQRAGLENVFSDVFRTVFTVNPESLMTRNIQALVTSQPLATRPISPPGIYRASPELSRPGPRLAHGLKALCQQM